jgi:hypothetical protein
VWRRLAVAAAVSGVAHALVALFGNLELPEAPQDRLPLAVRVVAVTPPAVATAAPLTTAPRNAPPRAGVRVAAAERVTSSIRPASAEPAEVATEEAPAVETAETPAHEAAVVAAVEEPVKQAEIVPERPARTLPRKGRITYNVVYGRDRFPVGRTIQTWEVDRERYQLASRSETIGIVDLFRSEQRNYSSRGTLTRHGLQPESFQMNRNRARGAQEASARFDWLKSTVTLSKAAETRQEALPPRSQDLLSFVYQLSLDPPPLGRVSQVVTNGSRIEVYELDVLREETIDTPLGALRTLPIKQVRKGNDEGSIQLWLALEYRYLPVLLRFFDRKGEPQGEQIVADIRLVEN